MALHANLLGMLMPYRRLGRRPSVVMPASIRSRPADGSRTSDEVGDGDGSVLLHGWDGMGVDVQGHRHGRMAEPFADDLRVHAGLKRKAGVGVAEVARLAIRFSVGWPLIICLII
jgi:hypothetical protein